MKRYVHWPRLLSALILLFALSACGNSAAIKSSQRIQSDFAKTSELIFIFKTNEFNVTASSGKGRPHWYGETGYPSFGPIIAAEAKNVFLLHQVNVLKSSNVDSNEPILSENNVGQNVTSSPILLIDAQTGRVTSDGNGAVVKILFTASLIDPKARKTVWTASIDTRTIAGSNAISKAMAEGRFDKKFAVTLLQKIAARMKLDGVI